MQQWVPVLMIVLWVFSMGYVFSGMWLKIDTLLHRPHHRWVNGIWRWTKWPTLVSVVGDIPAQIIMDSEISMWDYLSCLVNLGLWFYYKDAGDDDPMNKLKKKITEKVAEIGGKLVLVPAGA